REAGEIEEGDEQRQLDAMVARSKVRHVTLLGSCDVGPVSDSAGVVAGPCVLQLCPACHVSARAFRKSAGLLEDISDQQVGGDHAVVDRRAIPTQAIQIRLDRWASSSIGILWTGEHTRAYHQVGGLTTPD